MTPTIFVLNSEQNIAFLSTISDTLILNMSEGLDALDEKMFDVDNVFLISDVKQCINANNKFYVVANQKNLQKGLFLLQIDENPFTQRNHVACEHDSEHSSNENEKKRCIYNEDNFLINEVHLYDIADVDMSCTAGKKRII